MKNILRALLGIMVVQLIGCATGDYAKIDEVYKENMSQCADPHSELRKALVSYEACTKVVTDTRDEGRRNQYSLKRWLPGGGGSNQPIMVYTIN